ncbi:glycosyltransferase family 2 protein [Azospirillum doebereinerae]|uniref:Glycosyltransferase family 2 protein n=1 Tax=Azospirillum doebereinerae TaxID=92933 RepID=A0A3S1CG34_9PROT|nr:glycosyltransferase family 2 protein [Azospirillum doebereinerae]MCG5238843.1 glycosyltransferase family 2 protein [Azospirillum doebereinerae]RUQ68861.1 glycosyltransferase family 2 protein [Azospirillum doebereinerae]
MKINDDSAAPLARVIVVSYNSAAYVNRCLAALRTQTERRFEAVVVDNASRDADAIEVPDDPRFSLIRLSENTGFAAANNTGARGAEAPWIVTLNPDAFAEPGWLRALLEAAESHPGVAMFGSTQLSADDPTRLDGVGDRYAGFGLFWRGGVGQSAVPPFADGETFSPCAAAAMYRRDLFEQAGGFDESFFCYGEDVDLGFRIRLLGGGCRQVGAAVVHHVGSGITKEYGDFSLFHIARNGLWILMKNMPFPLILASGPLYLLATAYLLLFRWRGAPARTVRRGLRAALSGLGGVLRRRRAVQASRRISQRALMAAMIWDPRSVRRGD